MRSLLPLLLVTGLQAQTLDLSGEWRLTTNDSPANALVSASDQDWLTVILPRGAEKFLETYWLRKTVPVPAGADTLAVGQHLGDFEVYLNGRRVPARGRLITIPEEHRQGLLTIAVRVPASPTRIPLYGYFDSGPWLLDTAAKARAALAAADDTQSARTRPRVFLGGMAFASSLILVALWAATRRASWLLLWIGMGIAARAWTMGLAPLLGLSAQFGTFMAAISVGQLGLLALRADLPWARAVCAVGLALLTFPVVIIPVKHLSAMAAVLSASAIWRSSSPGDRWRAAGITFWLVYTAIAGTFGGLVWESRDAVWPVSSTLAVFLPATVVIGIELLRMREQQRDRQRLESEMQAARTMQQMLIPSAAAPGIDAAYHPAAEVGGDFWQAFPLPEGGGHLVALGDVSGKGLRAAMVVSVITGALRNRQSDHPASILKELNQVAAGAFQGGFVTMVLARVAGEQVTVASAGHPAPYLDGEELPLAAGLPLGVDPEAEFEEWTVAIRSGQQLTLISDGVVEAASAKGELFGFDRTRAIATQSAQAIAEAAQNWGQNDDITVVTVRSVVS